MLGIGTYSEQYLPNKELFMFDPIPQEQWLTTRQVANQLPDTSFSRVKEVLTSLRREYESLPEDERPYRQVGKSYLYHPDFVQLVNSRAKRTRGDKSENLNKN